MNPFNKREAVGLFVSVAVMALALAVMRFNTDIFAQNIEGGETQSAVVAVASEGEGLKRSLQAASTGDGDLIKLVIDDIVIGSGREVRAGDTVTVHYIGRTTDQGVEFDSSYKRGEPFSFTVGEGKVIEGWDKGLIGMKVGGQRILVIPSEMAYGNRQVGVIPPNSPLLFAVELLAIEE